jgi:hypothetical protein
MYVYVCFGVDASSSVETVNAGSMWSLHLLFVVVKLRSFCILYDARNDCFVYLM